ncbi:hypothetical protein SAMN05421823_103158 [Catalinimonas alkaloidigena]|uniref:Uncharacterized protein n=1 Tax=Catalinimonas alkaloidigena TaxID=1075417 RepID=A0A1G9DKA8_9BACT|nr:hypothetical protein [Catalinimonas alkaloidigena]SDK64274.1 hypothetical protein SAMN05421823_103158 [Catalinimonas alkaloidigena]
MNKLLLTLLLCLSVGWASAATETDLFEVDEQTIDQEFAQLDRLEGYLLENGGTYTEVSQNAGHLLEGMNLQTNNVYDVLSAASAQSDSPLGIPPFLWGFCLGVAGIAVVYFITEDTDMTKTALWGCLVSSALWAILYIVLFATSAATY